MSQIDFPVSSVNTTHFSLNFLRYYASKVWNMVRLELKNLNDVEFLNVKLPKFQICFSEESAKNVSC